MKQPAGPALWAAKYAAGMPMRRIASDHHVARERVRAAIVEAGIAIRSDGPQTGSRNMLSSWYARGLAMKHSGAPMKEIAAAVGRSPETVKWALQRLERGL